MTGASTVNGGPKIGLALGGGGSRGFAHLGVYRALCELGVPVSCIAGTSIGSIAGALIASGRERRAADWARDSDWRKLPPLFLRPHWPRRALLASEKIEGLLRKMIGAETFSDLKVPFAAVASDLFGGETTVMRSGDLLSAVRASMAIPGVFEPVVRDGRILVDGGLTDPVPVDVCRRLGAEKVIAVNLNAKAVGHEPPPISKLNVIGIIDQTFTVICDHVAKRTFEQDRPDRVLCPAVGDVMMLDFRNADKLIDIGYACAMERREELLALL